MMIRANIIPNNHFNTKQMKQERLEMLLKVAETHGSAAALKIAQEAGDVQCENTEVSAGMKSRIEIRQANNLHTKQAINGLKSCNNGK